LGIRWCKLKNRIPDNKVEIVVPGISGMAHVSLPDSYFIHSIKRQYSCPDSAIVREALQNSLDAGSTRIQMTVLEDGVFEIEDDGSGMSQERMVSALLTFGGSEKEEGSRGGFGSAKELILFAHTHFFIHSRDNKVSGRVLDYEMAKGEYRKGTLIRIQFHPDYQFNHGRFLTAAREVMKQSHFDIPVLLNGQSETGTPKGRCVRAFSWGKVHCTKLTGETSHYALVRAGGLCMFRYYTGAMDKQVVVEVSANPKDVFVSTRDRLVDSHSKELQELFNELVVDRNSFGRKANEKILFSGDKGAIDDLLLPSDALQDRPALEALMGEVVSSMRSALDEAGAKSPAQPADIGAAVAILNQVVGRMPLGQEQLAFFQFNAERIAQYVCHHTYDFLVHIENTRYTKIPDRYRPSNLSAKNRFIAQLWKHCIKLVLRANGLNSRLRIGWVLNDAEAALRVPGSEIDNIPAYLLNPDTPALRECAKNRKALFFHLFQVACHEVTHHWNTWHDESFGVRLGTVTEKAMMSMRTFGYHCRAARHEIL
jgi:hypothetical protein